MADETVDYVGPIVTREDALAQGSNRYFDGQRCGKGHLSQHYTGKGSCVLCGKLRYEACSIRHKPGVNDPKPMCQTPGCSNLAYQRKKTLCGMCDEMTKPSGQGMVKRAFASQRQAARQREIPFLFSYEQWVAWWEQSLGPDWFAKRGCTKGKFCMARLGDIGSYEASNVKCILHSENLTDASTNNVNVFGSRTVTAVINEEMAREIYLSDRPWRDLSEQYGISISAIATIRAGRSWRRATAGLQPGKSPGRRLTANPKP
jgi:hypothetical protein